jgi:hypothetical protein
MELVGGPDRLLVLASDHELEDGMEVIGLGGGVRTRCGWLRLPARAFPPVLREE